MEAAAARLWAQHYRDREFVISTIVPLVHAGQRQVVALVDAYFAAKMRELTGTGAVKGLDPNLYTTEAMRGVAAATVYERPFGALGGQLEQGASFADAFASAQHYMTKTVSTDMQMAQVRSARDWMSNEERIVGYRRRAAAGCCELCRVAATRTYRKEYLAPIHERCHCGIEPEVGGEKVYAQPLYGTEEVGSIGTEVAVRDDPELGARLVATSWDAAALPLMPGASEVERQAARQIRQGA